MWYSWMSETHTHTHSITRSGEFVFDFQLVPLFLVYPHCRVNVGQMDQQVVKVLRVPQAIGALLEFLDHVEEMVYR